MLKIQHKNFKKDLIQTFLIQIQKFLLCKYFYNIDYIILYIYIAFYVYFYNVLQSQDSLYINIMLFCLFPDTMYHYFFSCNIYKNSLR